MYWIFSKASVVKVKQFLLESLRNMSCLVEVYTGKVAVLYFGLFLKDKPEFPSNLYFYENQWNQ